MNDRDIEKLRNIPPFWPFLVFIGLVALIAICVDTCNGVYSKSNTREIESPYINIDTL